EPLVCVSVLLVLFVALSPARSPLFPYTTLFRSLFLVEERLELRGLGDLDVRVDLGLLDLEGGVEERDLRVLDRLGHAGVRALLVDRKSTRLNSSHGSISYAVFCLITKRATSGLI